MHVFFENMPGNSRIWIYQANRLITDREKNIISESLKAFTDSWLVHGQPMKSSFDVLHNLFIVLVADESFNEASGCSIDSSVRAIGEIGRALGINWFDRTQIAFLQDEQVNFSGLSDLKLKLTQKLWNADTLVFDNTIGRKADLETRWIVPAGTTWLKRYLPKDGVSP